MSQYQTTLTFKIDKTHKDHDLEVVVDRDGNIVSALVYVPIFDEWTDCTERVRSSSWRARVAEEYSNYDWSEHIAQEKWGA